MALPEASEVTAQRGLALGAALGLPPTLMAAVLLPGAVLVPVSGLAALLHAASARARIAPAVSAAHRWPAGRVESGG